MSPADLRWSQYEKMNQSVGKEMTTKEARDRVEKQREDRKKRITSSKDIVHETKKIEVCNNILYIFYSSFLFYFLGDWSQTGSKEMLEWDITRKNGIWRREKEKSSWRKEKVGGYNDLYNYNKL